MLVWQGSLVQGHHSAHGCVSWFLFAVPPDHPFLRAKSPSWISSVSMGEGVNQKTSGVIISGSAGNAHSEISAPIIETRLARNLPFASAPHNSHFVICLISHGSHFVIPPIFHSSHFMAASSTTLSQNPKKAYMQDRFGDSCHRGILIC